MNFFRIRNGLSLHHSLFRYNKNNDTNLHLQHIRILFFISESSIPYNRLEIVTLLRKRSFSINYTQLNKALDSLEKAGLIKTQHKATRKAFYAAPSGIELLITLERSVRKMRFDRIAISA